jgi:hypothetical protein
MFSKKEGQKDDAREAKLEDQSSFTSQQQPQQEEIRNMKKVFC